MRHPVRWRWNVLAYGLWVVSAFLLWLLARWSLYYLPRISQLPIGNQALVLIAPILQAISAWLILQIVIRDRRLFWLVAITLGGYFLGIFVERYSYGLVYSFFHLIPGNTVRGMLLATIMSILIPLVIIAVFQALFMGPILKRITWGFALSWIAAAVGAGVVAPAVGVLFELKYYSSSDMYPTLIQNIIASAISGLPLIWLRAK